MARRERIVAPKVPRSTPIREERSVPNKSSSSARDERVVVRGPRELTLAEMQAYTISDLKRIGLFGGLILAGMFALKFLGL